MDFSFFFFSKQCFYGGDDVDLCTTTGSASDQCSPRISKETPGEKDEPQQPKDRKSTSSDINDGVDEYPVEEEKPNQESMTAEDVKHDDQLSEDTIKKAIKKRGPYFRANLEYVKLDEKLFYLNVCWSTTAKQFLNVLLRSIFLFLLLRATSF